MQLPQTSFWRQAEEQEIARFGAYCTFDLRRIADGNEFVGISTVHNAAAGTMFLHQARYAAEVLRNANIADCRPVSTPLDAGQPLQRDNPEDPPCTSEPYLSVLGQCQYLGTTTRPDLAAALSQQARFASDPRLSHWQALKHLLRYLKGSLSCGICYTRSQ